MTSVISHKIAPLGKVEYNEQGILIETCLGLCKGMVNWSEIDFCCITPAIEKRDGEWIEFRGQALEELQLVFLRFAVKDRHELWNESSSFSGYRLKKLLQLSPLYGANEKPLPAKGVFSFYIKLESLSVETRPFIDFLSTKTKFDLICYP